MTWWWSSKLCELFRIQDNTKVKFQVENYYIFLCIERFMDAIPSLLTFRKLDFIDKIFVDLAREKKSVL